MPEHFQSAPAAQGVWDRRSARRALLQPRLFDLLVIGGGVIGASVARDAAGRGLSVALVEQNDFAGATSSKSTKLIHGGIRYLPHLRFGLVRQGLREQQVLRRTADYLYSDLDFVIPLFEDRGLVDLPSWMVTGPLRSLSLRVGLSLYDRLGGRNGGERHRRVGREDLSELFPKLRREALQEGFVYRDAQTDDARLTVSLLKTAVARHGAVAVSRMRAVDVASRGDGLVVTVQENGEPIRLRSRCVVAATWAFPPPSVDLTAAGTGIRFSKGVHLVYRADDLGVGEQALVLPETDDGRLLFIVPWRGLALLGTTDTPYEGDPGKVRPAEADVEYLERHLTRYMDCPEAAPLASFAGLRTLADGSSTTASASRGHRVLEQGRGMFTVVGGKLSSARVIATDVVNRACAYLGVDTPSRTSDAVLVGGGIGSVLRARLRTGLEGIGLPAAYGDHLIRRYGTESAKVLGLLEERPHLRLLLDPSPISPGEVVYTARNESVTTVGDFALRRTNLAWSCLDHGRGWAPLVAATLAGELRWSRMRTEKAISDYEDELVEQGL